ncbi:hypothetical protein EmuJ_000719900 [Echinococcus multilocularis]|uniref:Uncharacterized protein n=1 Tax=Echinococcus multilocularis TaxID=6211 RepID=A0A068Y549_ECHMU|nr:hypothetical protein EmuJ_000719900 [Echinococcus multilocularis]
MHHKAFCGLYTASAQGMLSAVSEKRLADELVNRAFEPSLLQHSGDAMVIVKRREEDGQLPLLILRRGYSRNSSALHQSGFNPNWWRVQLFSRNFQLPRSQEFDLVHQRLHGPYHYLFFNRAQSFHNPLDDFLSPPWRQYETQSTLVVRFCLNDNGFQMPDSGLAVFTTLLKAKLACSIRLPTSRNSPTLYTRNRDQETDSLVAFDRIVTSDSFVGPDKDLFYVGLFASTETSSQSQLFQQSLRLMGSPVALCIFRASDLSSMVTQAPLAVQMRNEPVRKLFETNRTFGGAVEESLRFLRLNGSAEQLDSLQDLLCLAKTSRSFRRFKGIICIPSHRVARSQARGKNQSSADEGLSLPEQCNQSDNHALIKGVYLQHPWMPADGGEAIALLQTKDRFVAMLVDTVKRSPVSPRRKLMQGREICVLYLLTETCQLIVFLVTKRGLFYEHELEDNVESMASNLKNLLISGGVEALFFIHFSPPFTSSHVRMEFASSVANVFYDKEGVAIAKYLSIQRDADAFSTQVFRWRTVKFACQLPYGRPRSNVTFPCSKGNIFTNGSVVTPSSSLPSPSPSSTEKTSLLLVVWILSVLFIGLSVACLFMVVVLLRLKSTYAKHCHRLHDSNANSESLYHQNTHQGHEKFSDVINLSQTSVNMEPEYHFSSILPPESKENVVGPLDVLAVPEALPKINTYTAATRIFLNSPSLPRKNQQLNNNLELGTFTIPPIRPRLRFKDI